MPNSGLVVRANVTSPAFQPSEQLTIDGVAVVAIQPGAHAGGEVDRFAAEVFDHEWNTAERTIGKSCGDRPTGPVGLDVDDGSDLLIGGHGVLEGRLEQFAGTHLLGPNQVRQAKPVVAAVLVMAHRRPT